MFFLHTLNLPSTFGGVAMSVLKQVCSNVEVVHVVCDTYRDGPSIKDCEHELHGQSQASYRISGPSQKRPPDLHSALPSATSKKELLAFLKDEWMSQVYASSLEGHKLYFATGQDCFLYMWPMAEMSRGAKSMSYKAIMKKPIQGSYIPCQLHCQ
jgi:hypothetical protein